MAWLSNTSNLDQLKKEYRTLARKWHPDVCQDPDAEKNFKEINEEYTAKVKGATSYVIPNFDEAGAQQKISKACHAIKDVLDETYPNTPITYIAWVFWGCLEFGPRPVPFRKVCECLSLAQQFLPGDMSYATFFAKTRKKAVEVRYDPGRKTFFADAPIEYFNTYLEADLVYDGRRYKVFQNKQWQHLQDTKLGIDYYLKRSPKIKIEELFGL